MTASILTVDDSSSLRMAICIALNGAGYGKGVGPGAKAGGLFDASYQAGDLGVGQQLCVWGGGHAGCSMRMDSLIASAQARASG